MPNVRNQQRNENIDLTDNKGCASRCKGSCGVVKQIPEFRDSVIRVEEKQRVLSGGVQAYFIMKDGKMVSTASTAAENSLSAMIVGVATLENYKKKAMRPNVF